MYNKKYLFTSDLINSYAWDTTIVFLQNCGNNSKYSKASSLNDRTIGFASTGTNADNYIWPRDNQCNVYDMASNAREWSTETATYIHNGPCVRKGSDIYMEQITILVHECMMEHLIVTA